MSLVNRFYRLDRSWRVLILLGAGLFITPQFIALAVAAMDVFLFQGNMLPSTPDEIDALLFPWYVKIGVWIVSLCVGLALVRRYAD